MNQLMEQHFPVVESDGLNTNKLASFGGGFQGKSNVLSGQAATVTLTAAQSNSVCMFDSAAGIVYTLPTAAAGLEFQFWVSVTITSNNAKVITALSTDYITGYINGDETDDSDATDYWPSPIGTHNIAVTQNGTTTGGVKGSWVIFNCFAAGNWSVYGFVLQNGTVATPFATS